MEIFDSNESVDGKKETKPVLIDINPRDMDLFANDSIKDSEGQKINFRDLRTTETDMMFQYIAHPNKMVDVNEREFFDKERDGYDSSSDTASNLDDYMNKPNDNTNTYVPHDTSQNTRNIPQHTTYNQHNIPRDAPRDAPHVPDVPQVSLGGGKKDYSNLSEEELSLRKLDMLRKLGELVQNHNVRLSQNYNINSDLSMMEKEFELHNSIRQKQNGLNWMAGVMMHCVYGLELANDKFNPFDFKLNGWSKRVGNDMPSYIDTLSELYEQYNRPGSKIRPEIKLVLMLTGSAIKFHLEKSAGSLLFGDNRNSEQDISNDPNLMTRLRSQARADGVTDPNVLLKERTEAEHAQAAKTMANMEMLRRQKEQYMKQQQEIEKLNRQLNDMQQSANPLQNLSSEQHEALRQQQIEAHKQEMKRRELERLNDLHRQMLANDELIKKKRDVETVDSVSVDTETGTVGSKILTKRRGRPKKKIQITTE